MAEAITLTVNGKHHELAAAANRSLLEVLREDLQLTGTKYGCGEGACGACTVLMDGRPTFSCTTSLADAAGKKISTIEGLAKDGKLHPVQEAFLQECALQCGYCTAGFIMETVALLDHTPKPSDEQIVQRLTGHLCRCCGYPRIMDAVRRAAGITSTETSNAAEVKS